MALGFSCTFGLEKPILTNAIAALQKKPGLTSIELSSDIGIGGKKAIGYFGWLLYLGLRDTTHKVLTPLGTLLYEYDPRLQRKLSLQLLHYQLCSNPDATVWWELANQIIPTSRSMSIQQAADLLKSKGIGATNLKNLLADVRNFFKSYERDQIFGSLEYLKYSKIGTYHPQSVNIEALLMAYILFRRRETGLAISTISIQNILTNQVSPGKLFNLSESQIKEKLRELESRGLVKVSHIADLDNMAYLFDGSALDILKMYYTEKA